MNESLVIGQRLRSEVLDPMKETFVGKEEIIDLLGVCLAGRENLFILGPPGTAKSALVYDLGRRLAGRTFEYLLTRFTEPNELFGPFDIRKLRDGVLETNTEGMLPEASLIFLDELLNANSAILNSLLTVLNERVLRRGREVFELPLLMAVGASNQLPQEEALQALFDRFLLRVRSDNVDVDELSRVLEAGWRLELVPDERPAALSVDGIGELHRMLPEVDLEVVRTAYLNLIRRIRSAGLTLSDRRAVKLQRLIAASALLCGRTRALVSDLWVIRYIWDREEQQEVLKAIVNETIAEPERAELESNEHPRGRDISSPNPEYLATTLDQLAIALGEASLSAGTVSTLRDRLNVIAGRTEWIQNETERAAIKERIDSLWEAMEAAEATS